MKMLVYDLMRLLRERSLMLWEHLLLAGFALQRRAPLKAGVVLSVEKDHLNCKIPSVCDTHHLGAKQTRWRVWCNREDTVCPAEFCSRVFT
jgi:hypothetical protein